MEEVSEMPPTSEGVVLHMNNKLTTAEEHI